MDTKARSIYTLSTRDQLETQGHIQTESEREEKIFHGNGIQKKPGVAVLISELKKKTKTKKKPLKQNYLKRQGRILHNGQGINQRKSYNN